MRAPHLRRMAAALRGGAVAALVALAASTVPAQGHEGHQALPTQGASVEGDQVRLAPEARAAVGLDTADVDSGAVEALVHVNADVAIPPDRHAFASTRLGGRLVSIEVRPGSLVEAGRELARVESLDLEALGLDLIQASTQLAFAARERERLEALVRQGLAAERERLAVEAEWRGLDIRLDAARRRLVAVGLTEAEVDHAIATAKPPRTLAVRAPIAGVVIHADVEVGRFVESTEHLFELADLGRVWIAGEVPEDQAGRVREGAEVRASFSAYPDREFLGTLERRAPAIDPRTSTLSVFAAFDNGDLALKPGLGGEMAIVAARVEDATVAPLAGVTVEGGVAFAFVELSEGTYQKKDLVLGLRVGDRVEVTDGLYPGDRIVTDGKHQLAGLFTLGVLRLSEAARRNLGVDAAEVDLRAIEEVVTTFGAARVQTGREVIASTRIHGKVDEVLVNVGDRVEAGQVLAVIDSVELEGIEIDLRRERLRLDLAEATRERLRGLAAEGISAERELLQAEREVEERANEVAGLRRQLDALGVVAAEIERVLVAGETSPSFAIRTPLAGVVRARVAVPGQVVGPGETLVEVAALSPLWIEAAVAAEDIARVRPGATVRARCAAFPDRVFDGRVDTTTHIVDEATRTLPVLVEVDNADLAMLPGMRCEAVVAVSAAPAALALPRAAIGTGGGRPFAILELPNGTFRHVPLELGRGDDRFVEVKRGLYPGDRVAVRGVEALRSALASVK